MSDKIPTKAMNTPKRAQRRAQLERKKRRAKLIYPTNPQAARYANHLATCSCAVCGNPRKYFGEKTRQELKADAPCVPAHSPKP